jgi:hypothetical protein
MQPTSPVAEALRKIRSENLRQQALETRSEPHVVIVELDLPHPVLKLLPGRDDRRGIGARWEIQSDSTAAGVADQQVAEMRKAIKKITGKAPEQFFPSSGAFVVTATGKQLQELACLPSVSAIWPNDPRRPGR